MGCSEKDLCIKCDRGGKVLVCSNSCCPLAVHEKCLGFPTRFDEMGKFYCPYCTYRELVEESHQAREKALSRKKALLIFLDGKLIDGGCQPKEFGTSNSKEPTHTPDASKIDEPRTKNDENQLHKANSPKDTHPEKEGQQQQDKSAAECCERVSQSQDSEVSSLSNHCDDLSREYDDVAGLSDGNHRVVVVGHRTLSGTIVACGEDYVGYENEETAMRFQMVKIRNSIPRQPLEKHDHRDQPQRTVENHLEDNHSVDSLVSEKQAEESFLKARKVGKDARTVHETIDNNEGAEVAEEKEDKTAASSQGDLSLGVHLFKKRGFEAGGSICTDSETAMNGKRSKCNDKSRDKSTNDNCFKRSNLDQSEKIIASTKSRQLTEPNSSIIVFPNGRRKRLLWTDEEVNMLKKAVENFATDRNKNIPWRKILEFGRHVFDGTRTPVDLKDKWRKIVAKERANPGLAILPPEPNESLIYIPLIPSLLER